MTTIDQGFLFVLLVIWYSIVFWLIFKQLQKVLRQSENILDNQATIILDKNSIGNALLNLSFFGSKILILLLAIYKNEISILNIQPFLKASLKYTLQKDYDNFSFIRVLRDGLSKDYEEYFDVIDTAMNDLVSDIKLGRL